jgi:hypothetical protein
MNFGELPFRNCLENRLSPKIGVLKVANRGRKSPDRLLLPPKKRAPEALGYFPNRFSTQ